MSHPSKRKGSNYEREIVHALQAFGWQAERAYASNGRALGEAEDVDLVAVSPAGARVRIQAKRRATLSKQLRVPDGADCTVLREDGQPSFVIVRLRDVAEGRVVFVNKETDNAN